MPGRSIAFVLLVTFLATAAPLAAAPDIDVVLASGEVRLFAGGGRKVPEGQKVSTLRRGDLVWTGKDGRFAFWIGGHTLVEATPGTFFGVMPQTVGGTPRRRVDVVCVFLGSVKAGSNWKKVPSDTQIRIMGPKGMRGTNAGPVVINVPLPTMQKTNGKDPVLAINLPKALEGVSKPLPYSEGLWGVASPAAPKTAKAPAKATTSSKTSKPATSDASATSSGSSRGGSIDDIVADAKRKAEEARARRKAREKGR